MLGAEWDSALEVPKSALDGLTLTRKPKRAEYLSAENECYNNMQHLTSSADCITWSDWSVSIIAVTLWIFVFESNSAKRFLHSSFSRSIPKASKVWITLLLKLSTTSVFKAVAADNTLFVIAWVMLVFDKREPMKNAAGLTMNMTDNESGQNIQFLR